MQVLKANNITKIYKGVGKSDSTKALNGISLEIERGEFTGIMGPSGSGKTTLLNVLSGIDRPSSGIVEISGEEINSMSKNDLALFRRRRLGFVFQEFNLLDSLTVKENIMLPMILDNKYPDEIINRTNSVMSLFNITDIMEKYPYSISGGQQQRTAISRAIINNPDIIFADEPTGNLDSKSSSVVMGFFEKLNVECDSTILMVTHDTYAASYCNRILFIKDGEINKEIIKEDTRKKFLDQILNYLSFSGGDNIEF